MNGVDKTNMPPEIQALNKKAPKPERKQDLGQEDFMKLMTTQMNQQDPFKPLDNTEMVAQMAQFSSLSGIKDMKDSMNNLATSMQSSQALQASSMVGRKVLVPGSRTELPVDGELAGSIDVPPGAENLKVKFINKAGEVVHSMNIGQRPAGTYDFTWNGETSGALDAEGKSPKAAPGTYTVKAEADVDGETQAVETLVADAVSSVSLGQAGQGMTLNLVNGGSAPLAKVKQIM